MRIAATTTPTSSTIQREEDVFSLSSFPSPPAAGSGAPAACSSPSMSAESMARVLGGSDHFWPVAPPRHYGDCGQRGDLRLLRHSRPFRRRGLPRLRDPLSDDLRLS